MVGVKLVDVAVEPAYPRTRFESDISVVVITMFASENYGNGLVGILPLHVN